MFNLEQSIAEWRRQMLAAGIKTPTPLDELESHLRQDFRALVSAGKSEKEAFELALSRLGSPAALRTEFNKIKTPLWWPVTMSYWLYTGLMILFVVFLALSNRLSYEAWRVGLTGNPFLLFTHVVTVTAGYVAAFLAGGFGILYVFCRTFQRLSPVRQQSLDRGVLRFGRVSAGLVVIATGLGMLWCRQHYGKFLMRDVKEIGAFCVIVWFVALSLARGRRWISERAAMLMSLVGNIIVGLAWFGAGILDHARRTHAEIAGFWPVTLAILLGIHILFIILCVAPAPAQAES
jgi:hypothetical protein